MAVGLTFATAATLKAQVRGVDEVRTAQIVPPGAKGVKNMERHCTACQLCVSICPGKVLVPSGNLETLMQPRSSYERGFCRPDCTKCSEVCPTGAIVKINKEQKRSIQIGHAVWDAGLCIPLVAGVRCGRCARHCPTGAIEIVEVDPTDEKSPKFPIVDESKCIGCGACYNVSEELFEMNDEGFSQVKVDTVPEELKEAAINAIEGCPTSAIEEVKE